MTAADRIAVEAETVRPSWLTLSFDCPPWCQWQDEHREHDHYDDRVHTARPLPEVVS